MIQIVPVNARSLAGVRHMNAPVGGFFDDAWNAATNFANDFQRGTTNAFNTAVKLATPDPSRLTSLFEFGKSAVDDLTGRTAAKEAQELQAMLAAQKMQLDASKAQSSAAMWAPFLGALPWVIGGVVVLGVGAMIFKSFRK